MMTAQELKEKLKEEDIRKLLIEMDATFYYEDDDIWLQTLYVIMAQNLNYIIIKIRCLFTAIQNVVNWISLVW